MSDNSDDYLDMRKSERYMPDGFISETAAEGYQQRIIKQMYDIAIQEIKSPGDTENGS